MSDNSCRTHWLVLLMTNQLTFVCEITLKNDLSLKSYNNMVLLTQHMQSYWFVSFKIKYLNPVFIMAY